MADDSAAADPVKFWEDRYRERDQIWSGRVNPVLAAIIGDLDVGSVLDLGCGEGGDAIWLAQNGWRVTGVDISATALARAGQAAVERRVSDLVTFEQCDLATDFPGGRFDLVSAQFLQSPVEFPRARVLQQAAAAVSAGGRLLIVEHGAAPPWMPAGHEPPPFPTPQETYAGLELVDSEWKIERLAAVEREATGPHGESGHLIDNVIMIARRA